MPWEIPASTCMYVCMYACVCNVCAVGTQSISFLCYTRHAAFVSVFYELKTKRNFTLKHTGRCVGGQQKRKYVFWDNMGARYLRTSTVYRQCCQTFPFPLCLYACSSRAGRARGRWLVARQANLHKIQRKWNVFACRSCRRVSVCEFACLCVLVCQLQKPHVHKYTHTQMLALIHTRTYTESDSVRHMPKLAEQQPVTRNWKQTWALRLLHTLQFAFFTK